MLYRNIHYEYSEELKEFVLVNSTLKKKNKNKPVDKDIFLVNANLIPIENSNWETFCVVTGIPFYPLHYQKYTIKSFPFLENNIFYHNKQYNYYVFLFQPERLLFSRFLYLEEYVKPYNYILGVNYELAWLKPGIAPLICVIPKQYFCTATLYRKFGECL